MLFYGQEPVSKAGNMSAISGQPDSLFCSREVGGLVDFLEELSQIMKLLWWAFLLEQLDGQNKSKLRRKASMPMSIVRV